MIGQVIINGILLGGIYALVSLGLTLIFGVMRIINFAHGQFLMLAMYATYWLFQLYGVDPYISILIVVPLMFVIGMVAYRMIIQPIIDASEMTHVFATLGLNLSLQGIALFLWQGDFRGIRTSYSSMPIHFGALYINVPRFIIFLCAIATILALFLFLKKTYTGKAIRASAQKRVAAQLMGVNLSKIYMIAFGIGIAIVGVTGAVLMPIYEVFPSVGSLFALVAFVVVVLGGLGNLGGALVGGIIIGVVESVSGVFIAPALKEGVYFIIFVIILLLRPTGIFGKAVIH
ncbi:MAG: branched-chain amino acid ABC transporter permease [Thermodesulfobacteriota bacterium]|jgi:branched-chain amino acid transport system permease protein